EPVLPRLAVGVGRAPRSRGLLIEGAGLEPRAAEAEELVHRRRGALREALPVPGLVAQELLLPPVVAEDAEIAVAVALGGAIRHLERAARGPVRARLRRPRDVLGQLRAVGADHRLVRQVAEVVAVGARLLDLLVDLLELARRREHRGLLAVLLLADQL